MNEKNLTKEELDVLRGGGTEMSGSGKYLHEKREGNYMCKYCDNPLFSSDAKFESFIQERALALIKQFLEV